MTCVAATADNLFVLYDSLSSSTPRRKQYIPKNSKAVTVYITRLLIFNDAELSERKLTWVSQGTSVSSPCWDIVHGLEPKRSKDHCSSSGLQAADWSDFKFATLNSELLLRETRLALSAPHVGIMLQNYNDPFVK